MRLFGRGKSKGDKDDSKPKEKYVICPHCYVDLTVERAREVGSACPSCKGKIDLDRISRARL